MRNPGPRMNARELISFCRFVDSSIVVGISEQAICGVLETMKHRMRITFALHEASAALVPLKRGARGCQKIALIPNAMDIDIDSVSGARHFGGVHDS